MIFLFEFIKICDKIIFMDKKVVLITGATGGIGREVTCKFVRAGYHAILVYHSNAFIANSLKNSLKDVSVYKCNLKSINKIEEMLNDIYSKFDKIDVLINCAGISHFGLIQDTTQEDYNSLFDSNVKSTIFVTKYVAKSMITHKEGNIINISSMWGKVGSSMESLYSATKGAINALTLSLAKELGPSNIRVNAVCPGLIDTKMNSELDDETIKSIVDSTPLNRIGKPEDVANLCLFLASEDAGFITGQLITIDGGLTL